MKDRKKKNKYEQDPYALSLKLDQRIRSAYERIGKPDPTQNYLEIFTPTLISDLYQIMTSCSDNQTKAGYVLDLMKNFGFTDRDGGLGTNIAVLTNPAYPGVVFKIALDEFGIADNFNDVILQKYVPRYARVYARDNSGIVSVQEWYFPMRSEYIDYYHDDILKFLKRLSEYFLVADLSLRSFLNYGIDRNGKFILIDGSDLYPLSQFPEELTCPTPVGAKKNGHIKRCGGKLKYDDDFYYMICSKCGSRFLPIELRPKKEVNAVNILSDGYSAEMREELDVLMLLARKCREELQLEPGEKLPKEVLLRAKMQWNLEHGSPDAHDSEDEDEWDDEEEEDVVNDYLTPTEEIEPEEDMDHDDDEAEDSENKTAEDVNPHIEPEEEEAEETIPYEDVQEQFIRLTKPNTTEPVVKKKKIIHDSSEMIRISASKPTDVIKEERPSENPVQKEISESVKHDTEEDSRITLSEEFRTRLTTLKEKNPEAFKNYVTLLIEVIGADYIRSILPPVDEKDHIKIQEDGHNNTDTNIEGDTVSDEASLVKDMVRNKTGPSLDYFVIPVEDTESEQLPGIYIACDESEIDKFAEAYHIYGLPIYVINKKGTPEESLVLCYSSEELRNNIEYAYMDALLDDYDSSEEEVVHESEDPIEIDDDIVDEEEDAEEDYRSLAREANTLIPEEPDTSPPVGEERERISEVINYWNEHQTMTPLREMGVLDDRDMEYLITRDRSDESDIEDREREEDDSLIPHDLDEERLQERERDEMIRIQNRRRNARRDSEWE